MSVKNKGPKNHWRCKTVAFRVSPEEDYRLDMQVKISGMFNTDIQGAVKKVPKTKSCGFAIEVTAFL